MSQNQRLHERKKIRVRIKLRFSDDPPVPVYSRDISEGGTFVLVENPARYPLGDLVQLTFDDPLNDNRYTEKDAVVVRVANEGIAAAFVEMEAF